MKKFNFDLRHLKALIAVIDTGSFSAAAEQLSQTQSAVSQLVSNIENNLNTQLLDRSKRPIRPTLAGHELYEFGAKFIAESKRAEERIHALDNHQMMRLRVGMIDSLVNVIGLDLFQFLEPRVNHVSLVTGLAPSLLEKLKLGDLDIILTMNHLEPSRNITITPILTEKYLAIMPKSWPEQSLKSLCNNEHYISYTSASPTGSQTLDWFKWRKLNPATRFETSRADTVLELIDAGLGWTLATPVFLAHNMAMLDNIQVMPLPEPGLSRSLAIATRGHELESFSLLLADEMKSIIAKKFEGFLPESWKLL
ncbi:LysR family transcriptional regulator [Photobacterium aphoticum]|uniref:Transcriptional regulator LysR family n=1 Tax=Photobacterium aphoticum TaxID=754436 RepID=A0A090QKJ0_9GAMM|nr:LysR family transcriptional regulator [Photobacterium aphoticum]KLV00407.1 hypothetical protein ABT58_12105 [Photobacterium aphoticum]PSU59748.1 LysR family transcriptional regulator [Photobacterium aphoticum]GAL03426.1 transcriptional regulator LysR family [Photobacterium aphoticum]GHA42662.1 LysR family transcriptional regulator [Photobacterium aphoticum]